MNPIFIYEKEISILTWLKKLCIFDEKILAGRKLILEALNQVVSLSRDHEHMLLLARRLFLIFSDTEALRLRRV